jgi:hypothetical protein
MKLTRSLKKPAKASRSSTKPSVIGIEIVVTPPIREI